ncbi:MAG: hypothetical protein WBQ44_02445 [Rhodococcus sp. (in: high G+C Gram-positive bacteria)]
MGDTMAMLVMTTVGFVGLAMAMLGSGSDLDFGNRRVASAYRQRWA